MSQPNAPAEGPTNATAFYDMLFCDNIDLYRQTIADHTQYPWNILFDHSADIPELLRILSDEEAETRIKLLATNKLLTSDYQDSVKELQAVIIEIAMEQGLDVLATYRDGKIRYLNHSGRIILWEHSDNTVEGLVDELFEKSTDIMNAIGTWDGGRLDPPATGDLRITLLATDGMYFGEGPQDVLFNDQLAGAALRSATRVLQHITSSVGKY